MHISFKYNFMVIKSKKFGSFSAHQNFSVETEISVDRKMVFIKPMTFFCRHKSYEILRLRIGGIGYLRKEYDSVHRLEKYSFNLSTISVFSHATLYTSLDLSLFKLLIKVITSFSRIVELKQINIFQLILF
jgi:hypothetical protein